MIKQMAARCGAHDGLGSSQPAGAAVADLNPEWQSRDPSPTSGQGGPQWFLSLSLSWLH